MKVLIISHNALSTYLNMGKTLLSLFSSFSPSELGQFYIYPSVPDCHACSSFFRITDKDVLRFFFSLKLQGSTISASQTQHNLFEEEADQAFYKNPKNKSSFRILARDLMWRLAPWYTKSFRSWLDIQSPECILVAPGDAKFIYDIALFIAKKRNIPIVTYVCDDYYFVKSSCAFLEKFQKTLLKRKIVQLLHASSHLVSICNEMSHLYSTSFHLPTTTIMTGSNYLINTSACSQSHIQTITYMGNLRWGRWQALCEIGCALDALNHKLGTNYALNIYTGETEQLFLSPFEDISAVKILDFVTGDEFDRVFHSAEALLHTEAFDDASIDLVKHSVSTKIADCLGSGIPLLAYGPRGIASMEHLLRNDCAFCITEQESLEEKLLEFFQDAPLRKSLAENALKTAGRFHNQKIQSLILKERISDVIQQHAKNN